MARRTTKRRHKSSGFNVTAGIIVFGTFIVILIVASILFQRPPVQKQSADKYFSWSEAFAYAEIPNSSNSSIFVLEVSFNITAIGGDATDVTVLPRQGNVAQEDAPYFAGIAQNETVIVGPIEYSLKVLSTKEDEGYPLRFRIISGQAEGEVTVYVTDFVETPIF